MSAAVGTRPRLGFLGVGWIGRQRLDAISRSGVAEIAAVADPAVEGALRSLDELLDAGLDGVVVATPSALHAEQAVAALERGLAVFCQKPLALDAAGAREVVDTARSQDLLLGVDLSYRLTAAAQRVREVVSSGELGEVRAVDVVFHNAYGPDKPWHTDPALGGGGCVLDLGIHVVDLALWALGFPAVTRVTSRLHGAPLEEYAAAQIELESGTVLRLACSWWLHAGRDCVLEASFYGTRGGVSLRNVDGSFYDLAAERYDGTRTEQLVAPPDDWGGRAAVEWARALAGGARFDPAAEEYVAVHEVLDRIYGGSR
ncbi:MAG: Gfo/Idh/MocA family oxidoreductase [Actinobacteria bacterium]|nr:Gfo/Idh/MocA family oxidoreductase [Actinomycetota bacterium]